MSSLTIQQKVAFEKSGNCESFKVEPKTEPSIAAKLSEVIQGIAAPALLGSGSFLLLGHSPIHGFLCGVAAGVALPSLSFLISNLNKGLDFAESRLPIPVDPYLKLSARFTGAVMVIGSAVDLAKRTFGVGIYSPLPSGVDPSKVVFSSTTHWLPCHIVLATVLLGVIADQARKALVSTASKPEVSVDKPAAPVVEELQQEIASEAA
jgi:hypothetical protein